MRSTFLLSVLTLVVGCAPTPTDAPPVPRGSDIKADGTAEPACSKEYWDWVYATLMPALDQPISAVSDDDMQALVAARPDAAYTKYGNLCWELPLFDKYVYAAMVGRLHDARVKFFDSSLPDYLSLERLLANEALTPEMRRNAIALLALRPDTFTSYDMRTWLVGYNDLLGYAVSPIGIPSATGDVLEPVEPEWVVDDTEQAYLDLYEQARPHVADDGGYREWLSNWNDWMFGPAPSTSTESFVFNAQWLPDASAATSLQGLRIYQCQFNTDHADCSRNGEVYFPGAVEAFIQRLSAPPPTAVGDLDSDEWMSLYNARTLRALADASQQQAVLDAADELALQALEAVAPAKLVGLSSYQTWIDLYAIQGVHDDVDRGPHMLSRRPCLAAADLAAAQAAYDHDAAALGPDANAAVPVVCD